MSRKLSLLAISLFATLTLISCQQTQPPTDVATSTATPATETAKKAPVADLEGVANRLVARVAGVQEGEVVFISGSVRDAELLENLRTSVRQVGAFPLVTLNSDRMFRQYYEKVPEKYDSQTPELELKLANLPAVAIVIDSNESDDIAAGISTTRRAAVGKAGQPVADLYLKRNVRSVEVGNGIYPTGFRAKRFGMSEDDLAKTFWEAVSADYSAIQETGDNIRTALAAGKEVHITNPNGTDLKVKIEGRSFFVSDGVISADDIKKGGPAVAVYLPAGEVYCAPVPNTANGKVVQTLTYYNGKEVNDLTLTFVDGKVTAMTGAGPGFAELKADYDAREAGKELFAFVDFGINPNLKIWPTSKIGNWVQSGMVTVGIGSNAWAGGDNKISYGLTSHLPGCTVSLDGKTIIENGALKL